MPQHCFPSQAASREPSGVDTVVVLAAGARHGFRVSFLCELVVNLSSRRTFPCLEPRDGDVAVSRVMLMVYFRYV